MPEGFKLLDAYVEVQASGKGLADKVASDIQSESGSSSRLGGVGSAMGGHLFSGLKSVIGGGAVGGLVGGLVGGVTSTVTSVISGAISDVGSMLTQVGGLVASTVIDFNSQLQNADIGFTTMLGSAAKAKGFLNDLQDFAKSTPFEFGNLVSNAQNMMGMGIAAKDVIPDLRALGDSVASIGGSASQVDQVTLAFDQMAAKGTLDMGNMNQLMQGGVPSALKIMAAGFHTTTGRMIEMISTGKVQANVALPMLVKGIEHGTKATAALGGMMDKQSTTFTGALSNIQDGLTQTTAKAFKPFFDVASTGMQKFASALSGKPAQKFTKDVTNTLKPFADEIGKWFKTVDFNKLFKDAGKGLKDLFKDIKPKDVIKTFQDIGKGAGDIFKSLMVALPQIIKAIKDFMPVALGIGKWVVDTTAAFAHGADQWHDIFGAIGKWFNDTVKAFQHGWDQISGFIAGAVKNFQHGGKQIGDFFAGIVGFLSDTVKNFQHGWDQIAGFLDDAVGNFKHGADQIVSFFTGIPDTLGTIGSQMVDGLVNGFKGAFSTALSVFTGLIDLIPIGIRKLLGIASPSKVFHTIGTQVGQGLHLGLLGTVDQIKVASGKLVDAIHSGFTGPNVARNVAHIHAVAKALEHLSTARDKAATNLAGARSNLNDILGQRRDFATNVRSGVMGNANVTSLFMADPTVTAAQAGTLNGRAYQPSWTTTSRAGLSTVKASLQKLLADTKKFAANLTKLIRMGIDPATYDELVQAGVRGGGLETSAAFLADPTMARSIFSLERQIGTAGGRLGNQAATHEFAGQVRTARAAVAHDQRVVNHINVQMVVEAKKIDEVQKLIHMVTAVKQTARKGKK